MTNMFPHMPDFAWISHALPLKVIQDYAQTLRPPPSVLALLLGPHPNYSSE